MNPSYHVVVGVLTYNSERYLSRFLPTLVAASERVSAHIVVMDNASTDGSVAYIQEHYPQIKVIANDNNVGFSAGHNQIIRRAAKAGAQYYACINPDMILREDFLERILTHIYKSENVGSAGGKLLQWDGFMALSEWDKQDNHTIDAVELTMTPWMQFRERGQNMKDDGKRDENQSVWGISGAAVVYNMSALEAVAEKRNGQWEYFDERIFAYKEDCDLAFRLRQAGYSAAYVAEAAAYHHRSVTQIGRAWWALGQVIGRQEKSLFNRSMSFAHQMHLYKKHRTSLPYFQQFLAFLYHSAMVVYVFLFERESFRAWREHEQRQRK